MSCRWNLLGRDVMFFLIVWIYLTSLQIDCTFEHVNWKCQRRKIQSEIYYIDSPRRKKSFRVQSPNWNFRQAETTDQTSTRGVRGEEGTQEHSKARPRQGQRGEASQPQEPSGERRPQAPSNLPPSSPYRSVTKKRPVGPQSKCNVLIPNKWHQLTVNMPVVNTFCCPASSSQVWRSHNRTCLSLAWQKRHRCSNSLRTRLEDVQAGELPLHSETPPKKRPQKSMGVVEKRHQCDTYYGLPNKNQNHTRFLHQVTNLPVSGLFINEFVVCSIKACSAETSGWSSSSPKP